MPARFDLLSLYAYADKAHAKDRDLWRNFLVFLLPVLFEAESSEIGRCVDDAILRSPEECLKSFSSQPLARADIVRMASVGLADALGLPGEMGLAAFIECNPPTRAHAVRARGKLSSDEALVSRWLNRFSKVQEDHAFAGAAADWKKLFDSLEHASEDHSEFSSDEAPGSAGIDDADDGDDGDDEANDPFEDEETAISA